MPRNFNQKFTTNCRVLLAPQNKLIFLHILGSCTEVSVLCQGFHCNDTPLNAKPEVELTVPI